LNHIHTNSLNSTKIIFTTDISYLKSPYYVDFDLKVLHIHMQKNQGLKIE